MESGLLVYRGEDSGLGALLRCQRGGKIDLEAVGDLVVNLNLVAKDVGGGPGLGESQTMLAVGPLALDVTSDKVGLRVARTANFEGDVRRSLGFDFERCSMEMIVLGQQVVGGLAKILVTEIMRKKVVKIYKTLPSRKGERAEEETCYSKIYVELEGLRNVKLKMRKFS